MKRRQLMQLRIVLGWSDKFMVGVLMEWQCKIYALNTRYGRFDSC